MELRKKDATFTGIIKGTNIVGEDEADEKQDSSTLGTKALDSSHSENLRTSARVHAELVVRANDARKIPVILEFLGTLMSGCWIEALVTAVAICRGLVGSHDFQSSGH